MTAPQHTVHLATWRGVDPQTGERDTLRWSIKFEGKVIVTRGTEFEVRQHAREMRWRIQDGGGW